MKVEQYFTGHGILGVILFVGGNIASSAFVYWLLRATPFETASTGFLLFGAAAGFAVLISVPLMLIGRAYQVSGSLPS
jgi:hypothetical protein